MVRILDESDRTDLEKSIASKVPTPSDVPTVGKILKVKAVNADGTFVCEWADETGGSSLPEVTSDDNGKILNVSGGEWGKSNHSIPDFGDGKAEVFNRTFTLDSEFDFDDKHIYEYSDNSKDGNYPFTVGKKYSITFNGKTYADVLCSEMWILDATTCYDDYVVLGNDGPWFLDIDVKIDDSFTVSVFGNDIVKLSEDYVEHTTADAAQATADAAQATADAAQATADAKMDKVNPTGSGSLSIGRKDGTTVGNKSCAIGYATEASNEYSVALGDNAKSTGVASTAIGESANATARLAVSIGNSTKSAHTGATAIGFGCTTGCDYQTVIGRNNEADASAPFVVGNGTDDKNRKTIFKIDENNNPHFVNSLGIYMKSIEGKDYILTIDDGQVLAAEVQ